MSEINWVSYAWEKRETHPPKYGRYLVYRKSCDKIHFCIWNGSGWATENNTITHYYEVKKPC